MHLTLHSSGFGSVKAQDRPDPSPRAPGQAGDSEDRTCRNVQGATTRTGGGHTSRVWDPSPGPRSNLYLWH